MTAASPVNPEAKRGELYTVPHPNRLPLRASMTGINDCDPDYHNFRDCSNITVLGHVIAGQGTVRVDSSIWHPSRGETFVLPKYALHEVYAEPEAPERWVYIWINVEDDAMPELLRACGLHRGAAARCAEVGRLFERGLALAANAAEAPDELQRLFSRLLYDIAYRLGSAAMREERGLTGTVQAVKDYLDGHVQRRVTIEELCRHTGRTARQINNSFRREMGVTPYRYLLEEKVALAKKLLEQTDLAVQAVAGRLGFADVYYFSNLFKLKTGLAPAHYRKEARASAGADANRS